MHQLGDELNREDTQRKIRQILTARRQCYQAGIELLECDNTFAAGVKRTLESMTFANKVVNIVGAGGRAVPIDAAMIRFYLETSHRIYVREENITVDVENQLCSIKLNDEVTAKIPIKDGIGIKSLMQYKTNK